MTPPENRTFIKIKEISSFLFLDRKIHWQRPVHSRVLAKLSNNNPEDPGLPTWPITTSLVGLRAYPENTWNFWVFTVPTASLNSKSSHTKNGAELFSLIFLLKEHF